VKRLRALKVEQVSARLTEAQAAQLDDYVRALQLRMGDDVVVHRADAVRIVLENFLRRRSSRQTTSGRKR